MIMPHYFDKAEHITLCLFNVLGTSDMTNRRVCYFYVYDN